jgi:hypothetical protein
MKEAESKVGPFKPDDRKIYRVFYEEEGKVRYLLGHIQFSTAGGVTVTRADTRVIYLSAFTKIEEDDGRRPEP